MGVTAVVQSASEDVSGSALMGHMRVFAERTKLSGTPEERESFEYLRGEMAALGFHTTLLSHDAYISLPGAARVEVDGRALDRCITHSFSRPSPPGGVTGPLVYVGEGAEADFQGRDLRDAILLVEGVAKSATAMHASRAGAAAQIHFTLDGHLHDMCISPVWGSPSLQKKSLLPRTVVATIARPDGERLRARLERGEHPQVTIHAEVDTGWRKTPLLVADLDPPGVPDAPYVLFSGHHDTWYYGVMDNGGANATMIEVARVCAARREAWRRGLRVGFWSGHSHGRYSGSAWYADHHFDDLDRRCLAHVNVDSTGGRDAGVMTEAGTAAELRRLAGEVIERETGETHAGRRIKREGDQSFWGIGVPAAFVTLSQHAKGLNNVAGDIPLGWWWHTPDDTLDKIDERNLVRDTRIYADFIWRLLTAPVAPLDIAAQVDDLLAELRALERLARHPACAGLIDAATALRTKAAAFADRARKAEGDDAARIDKALMRVSRMLVPLDYTTGDRFSHDPAVAQPAWPSLQPLRDLAAADPSGEEAGFLAVEAVRARNRIMTALRMAADRLDEALSPSPAPLRQTDVAAVPG